MTAEHLKSLRDAHPFKPFTIHVSGGKSFRIPHRDFLSMSPNGRIVIVYHQQSSDTFSFVDLFLVGEVTVENVPADAVPATSNSEGN